MRRERAGWVLGIAALGYALMGMPRVVSAALIDGSIDISQFKQPLANATAFGDVTTFLDQDMNPADWTPGPLVFSQNSGSGSQTNVQALTGGDPGAFLQSTTVESAASTSAYRQAYFNNDSTYDPAVSGAIGSVSGGFNMNLLAYSASGDVYDAEIVLLQDGTVYTPLKLYGLQQVAPGWYGSPLLFGAGSPVAVDTPAQWQRAAGSGPAHPDFSAAGSPIQFGVMTGSYFDLGSGTNVGGLDNWTVSVTSASASTQPEPGAVALVGMGVALLRHRRRGK